ncbi:putative mannosyl-glycoprotein endo-beta-N-acetylglucosaminidase [Blattamonas nauphoetae]|uniref:Mannosyl-glycoprotein endo-beta-N-acetylglucosaminidase n=1 Tax=Blattamonas nauphoetae TaxID=2049346 RepID=A0ABQ9YAQ3_9EUKA|nr:putative mannosyl-glycoprotein endo-beta-N-acetylglucosaminidase [Blattamonas nauphoetae]
MNSVNFVMMCTSICTNYKTSYMWGTYGAVITNDIINAKVKQYPERYKADYVRQLRSFVGKGYFGFDCVGMIKGTLWGFRGDPNHKTGGAVYKSNGVPDNGCDTMFRGCKQISADWRNIINGEAVWMSGHIGVYIGSGKVAECTAKWGHTCQITGCANMGNIPGMNMRSWEKHGRLPYVSY